MDPVKKSYKSKVPKRGKAKQITRTESFDRRQRKIDSIPVVVIFVNLSIGDKLWLESHIWHAKRMKMENMWGYRLVRLSSI